MRRFGVRCKIVLVCWLVAGALVPFCAQAQDLLVGARERLGGALAMAFDPDAVVRVFGADRVGDVSVYGATEPGFKGLDDVDRVHGVYPLMAGTHVDVEITAVDGRRTAMRIGTALLAEPGASARLGVIRRPPYRSLDRHPGYQLVVPGASGTFGEATISFRLTTRSPLYGPSRVYTLRMSNGFLPAIVHPTRRTLRCQRLLARRVWAFVGATMDSLAAADADGTSADEAVIAGRRAVVAAGAAACRVSRSIGYDDAQINAHVGLAEARVRSLMGIVMSADLSAAQVLATTVRRFLLGRAAHLRRCLVRVQAAHVAEARGRVASGSAALACADPRLQLPDDHTMLGRILRARRGALMNGGRKANQALARTAIREAECVVDEIVSATFAGAKEDLAGFVARRSYGGRPLPRYFPCLAAGGVG